MIYCIGDSHVFHFSLSKFFSIKHIGPALAYQAYDKWLPQQISPFVNNISSNNILLFSFGEIDCRCHIAKYLKNSSIEIECEKVLLKYIKLFHYFDKKHKLICSIPHQIHDLPYKEINDITEQDVNKFIAVGSYTLRQKITNCFRNLLLKWCEDNKIQIFDIMQHPNFKFDYDCFKKDNIHIDSNFAKQFCDNFAKSI